GVRGVRHRLDLPLRGAPGCRARWGVNEPGPRGCGTARAGDAVNRLQARRVYVGARELAMARIPVESGSSNAPFLKWSQIDPGHVIEGTFLGTREGKYGLLADLETRDGALTLPLPGVLERQLSRVKVGAVVTIQYDGLQHSPKTDRDYHSFTTFVADAADL